MKLWKAALEITTTPNKNTLKKMQKDLEAMVEGAFTHPFRTSGRVLGLIGQGLKRGIKGAIDGAFKTSGSVTEMFNQIVEQTKKSLEEVYKDLDESDDLNDASDALGLTKKQMVFLDNMAGQMDAQRSDLIEMINRFQDARNKGTLQGLGVTQDMLGGKGAGELKQFMRFLETLMVQKDTNVRNNIVREVLGNRRNVGSIDLYSASVSDMIKILKNTQKISDSDALYQNADKVFSKNDKLRLARSVEEKKGSHEAIVATSQMTVDQMRGIIKTENEERMDLLKDLGDKMETLKKTLETQAEIGNTVQKILGAIMPLAEKIATGIEKIVKFLVAFPIWWKKHAPRWLGGG